MIKSLFNLLLIVSIPLFFSSCSNKTAETGDGAVNLLCDCFIDAGIENEYDLMDIDNDEKQIKEIIKCVLPILKDARGTLDDMSDADRAEYFGDAIKAAADCDCGIKLLEIASKMYDYDEAEDGIDEVIEELEWLSEHSYNDYYYDDYYYDDYEEPYYDDYDDYDDYDYAIDEGNGYDIVITMMDAIYYGEIELDVSSMYDIENVMDIYAYDEEYVTIDKYFDGYSFTVDFYFEYGVLSSISCNTFYDSGYEYEAEQDSEEILEYLTALFGSSDYGDYNDWTFDDQEISFNIFSDGYSLYLEPPYDEDEYDY